MSTWITLAVAALGIAGTLGGAWLTQRRADKRETANWNRELEREQARWAREDTARTFEHRRQAYVDFYQAAVDNKMQSWDYIVDVHIEGEPDRPIAGGGTLQEALDLIQIYGSPRVRDLAEKVKQECWRFRREAVREDLDLGPEINKLQDEWEAATTDLLDAIREELGVPNTGASGPVS